MNVISEPTIFLAGLVVGSFGMFAAFYIRYRHPVRMPVVTFPNEMNAMSVPTAHLLAFCQTHGIVPETNSTELADINKAFCCSIDNAEIKDGIFLGSCNAWGCTPQEAKARLAASMSMTTIAVRRDAGREDIRVPRLYA